jgi:chromosome segregation ATPase
MADRTNTTRIEELKGLAGDLVANLRGLDVRLVSISETLKKCQESTESHNAKIIVIEQQLLVLMDLKTLVGAVTAVEKDLALLRKDVEALQKWKEELKKEKDEATRRWWAFGPNITAAIIGGIITLIGIGVNVALNYWTIKPK